MKPLPPITLLCAILASPLLLTGAAYAAPAMPLISVTDGDVTRDYSLNLQILLLLTALTLLPAALLCMTSFTRFIIVLAILRQALGLQQTPPNRVLISIALFLTLFVMRPVFDTIWEEAIDPWMREQLTFQEAVATARDPIHRFMQINTRTTDLEQFMTLSGADANISADDIPLTTLIPAFLTSELKTAFQIGFLLFLPFLVIDLIVSSILMALGMIMLSPLVISLPLKLMVFVLVDGWNLTVSSLAGSVAT